MRVVSAALPEKFRLQLRNAYDSMYCKHLPDKETLGGGSQWTIATRFLHPDAIVYSGGVGGDVSFEQELIRRFGVKIHIFDPSPIAQNTIAQAQSDQLLFQPVGLSGTASANGFSIGGGTGDTVWFKTGGDHSVSCTSLPYEMKKNGHQFIDLLKIDIEGFEYDVLDSCFAANIPIKQICVEFHHFFSDIPKSKTSKAMHNLRARGFEIIHRNRYDYTFLNTQSTN